MNNQREIAFIDRSIANLHAFLRGLRPEVEPVLLDSQQGALAQIAKVLNGRSALSKVHIVAHGQAGEVSFSSGALRLENLGESVGSLTALSQALGEPGQLLLWTCHTALGERGQAFVAALAQLTGVKVVASAALVGSQALGGSWALEARNQSDAPLTLAGIAAYQGVMATFTATTGSDNITGTDEDDKFNIAAGSLQSADKFDGGLLGLDTLALTTGGCF